jgi:hypothetical protein
MAHGRKGGVGRFCVRLTIPTVSMRRTSGLKRSGTTSQGYEAMHMLRKGQIEGMTKRNVLAQNCVINQLFGVAA